MATPLYIRYPDDGSGGGGGGSAVWGMITGTLSNQTDLQNALNAKANVTLNNLTNPTSVSQSLIPAVNITQVLGSNAKGWGPSYISILNDQFNIESIDTYQRFLYDSNPILSVDYGDRVLYDTSTLQSMDWLNRLLFDAGGSVASVDYGNRTLVSSTNIATVDYDNTRLLDNSATTQFALDATGLTPTSSLTSTNTTLTIDNDGYIHSVAVTPTQLAGLLVDSLPGFIPAPANASYTLDESAAFPYQINTIIAKLDSGTVSAALQINGTPVTGISAVSLSSTQATGTASGANTVSVGQRVTLVLSSASSPANLGFTMKITRT